MTNITQNVPKTETTAEIENELSYVENMKGIYKIAFEMFDKDKSNSIDHDEFRNLMMSLGYDLTDNEIDDLMFEGLKREKMKNENNHQYNNNNNLNSNVLSLSQFVTIMNTWRKERDVSEDYMEAFRVFDYTGGGKIEASLLEKILIDYGEGVTPDEIKYMLNDADVDGDGMIDYKNFVRLLFNK